MLTRTVTICPNQRPWLNAKSSNCPKPIMKPFDQVTEWPSERPGSTFTHSIKEAVYRVMLQRLPPWYMQCFKRWAMVHLKALADLTWRLKSHRGSQRELCEENNVHQEGPLSPFLPSRKRLRIIQNRIFKLKKCFLLQAARFTVNTSKIKITFPLLLLTNFRL